MNQIKSNLQYFLQLLLRLGIMLVVFMVIKIIFYAYNMTLFPVEKSESLLFLLGYAMRFDLAAIIYVNALFILMSLLPLPQRQHQVYRRIQNIVFLFFNGLAIIFELIDIGFFKFAFRRTIGSDLNLFSNTAEMAPGFIAEYWMLLVFFALLMFLIHYLYNKTNGLVEPLKRAFSTQIGVFLLGLVLFGIGARGGIQLRPIMPITATQFVKESRLAPLVSNTSLSLIFSVQQNFLVEKNYFPKAEQEVIFNTHRQYHPTGTAMDRKNICILVLESFGKEHLSYFNKKLNTTPFLDDLIDRSFYLEQTYANGLRSTQGIVAITSSIPSLMNSPLMFSAYQSNRIDGLGKLLSDRGYISTFFHGANPGSMEFERFSKLTGFQNYLDRPDFNNDAEYDGQWGIWDEPYFQYVANQVNDYDKPFCAMTFSLTSHHPYKTPKQFEQKYPDMDPLLRSIRYTDYALEKFFDTAQKMPWYQNTIFVITADHVGKSSDYYYQTKYGRYAIPILIFDPSQEVKGMKPGMGQQIDIMPTLLDLLKYDAPFKAYGESFLDTLRTHQVFNFHDDIYQIWDKDYLLLFDKQETIGLYQYPNDVFLKDNLIDDASVEYKALEDRLKAVIQQHHKEMIENRLYLEEQ